MAHFTTNGPGDPRVILQSVEENGNRRAVERGPGRPRAVKEMEAADRSKRYGPTLKKPFERIEFPTHFHGRGVTVVLYFLFWILQD